MTSKWLKREKYVMVHGQSRKFRVVKWIILFVISFLLFLWKGWSFVGMVWVILVVFGTGLHFLFRYKTHGWRQPWGFVKEIKTPFD